MRGATIKLTAFTVFTIIVTFWLASVIGKIQPFQDTYQVKTVFSDATGVLIGDPVKIAGVPVGKVTGFEVKSGRAILTLEIDGNVEVPENAIFDIKFLNLLGQRVINVLRPETESTTMLADGDTVPVTQTRPALDLSVVFNNLRPLIQTTNPEDINTVARAVVDIFENNEDDLARTLGNLGNLSKTLAARDQRLARLVEDLDEVTKILNRRSSSIRKGLRTFTELMDALAELTPRLERVVVQLDEASTRFGGVVARNRSNLDQELSDLRVVLRIINGNLRPLDKVAKNLKEILLATARTQSYGKWWNLYVVNFCPEKPVDLPAGAECDR